MVHLELQTVNCWRVCIPPALRAARKSALSPSVCHLDGSLHCLFNYMYIIGNYTRKQISLQVICNVLLEYAYLVWLTKEYGDLLVILDTCLDKGDRWYTEIRTHTQTSLRCCTIFIAHPPQTHLRVWDTKLNAQPLHWYIAKCRHKHVVLCCGIVLHTHSFSASIYCSIFLCF